MIGICGASGYIGQALYKKLKDSGEEVLGTFCHNPKEGMVKFDLRDGDITLFDGCDFVVVASAYAKIKFCEDNKFEAFWLNVFRTVYLLDHLDKKGIPALFISSNAAEILLDTNYGKYKKIVEDYITKKELKKCKFIRPGKVNNENIEELCQEIMQQIWAYKGRKD